MSHVFPLAAGLIALLSAISVGVIALTPAYDMHESYQLKNRQMIWKYYEAERIAERLFPDPSARWSHLVLSDGAACQMGPTGVWIAQGTVETGCPPFVRVARWLVIYSRDESLPLYACVGETKTGDLAAAIDKLGLSGLTTKGMSGDQR